MSPEAFRRRCIRIQEIGCLACKTIGLHRIPEVHHQNTGGHAGHKRVGDHATVGLCTWHHRGIPPAGMDVKTAREVLGPSLALLPNKFREVYGTDDELLDKQNDLIARRELLAAGHTTVKESIR